VSFRLFVCLSVVVVIVVAVIVVPIVFVVVAFETVIAGAWHQMLHVSGKERGRHRRRDREAK